MTDLTLEQRMQKAQTYPGSGQISYRSAAKVAEEYAAEQTAAQETRHTLALIAVAALVAVVEEAQATIDSLRAQVERLETELAEVDSLIAAWTEERLDAQETAIKLRAQVERLTAENEALRELLQAFAISPDGVILRPEQADLYRSVLAETERET